jgi:hypothetical protein
MDGHWTPRDHEELTAGWRLWLALSSSVWPRADWDGSPAGAVRGLRELMATCDQILSDYLAAGGAESAEVVGLLWSMAPAASWTCELWDGDSTPLDSERAALLHSDISGLADHSLGVRTLLAQGGGWASLTL